MSDDTPTRNWLRQGGRWLRRCGRWLRRNQFNVVLPTIATVGLLGYVSMMAASPQSSGQIVAIVERTWWIVLVLTIPYIGARAILWHELLEQLDVNVPWRLTLAAMAGGEIAKTIPGGIYVQNFLLARASGLHEVAIVRSSTATTATLALESLLALPVALIVGVPGAPWVTWTLLGIIGVWVVLLVLVVLAVRYWELHLAPWTPNWLRRLAIIAEELLEAAADLITWRTVRAILPTAVYMLVYVADLYVIAGVVGATEIGWFQIMGIYAIVVLSTILVPIPVKVGTTELTGLTAFVAHGVSSPTAALVMLALRLLTTGATMLVAAVLIVALRHALMPPPTPPSDMPDRTSIAAGITLAEPHGAPRGRR
ncbi:MAG: flippase-like domain-containing protein [Chloroflexi bacterium]|nr:flippase-like domain-containing protein [Chloroflexota bacterium]